VGELVHDEPVEEVRGLVEREQHPVAIRFGERAHALLRGAGDDVLLFELAVRLEDDQRHLEGEVVLQFGADLLIRALGVTGHAFEVLFLGRVVVDLEMVGGVDVPVEVAPPNQVLAVVRNERSLRASHRRGRQEQQGGQQRQDPRRGDTQGAGAHTVHLEEMQVEAPKTRHDTILLSVAERLQCMDLDVSVDGSKRCTTQGEAIGGEYCVR